MKATTKIYKVICLDFGHKFSFNAKDNQEAEKKLLSWLRYHSFDRSEYLLEETTELEMIHDEYVD